MNLFLVMLMRRPACDPAVVPAHLQYLDELRARRQVERSGPFADRSGGAYLLRATDMDAALAIVHADPVHRSGGWDVTVHEWQAR